MERRGRIIAALGFIGLGFALVMMRLAYLQVIDRTALAARAERQQEQVVTLEPKRGTILDRTGRELAVSLDVDSVYGIPSQTDNPRKVAARLSPILREDQRTLARKLSGDKHFVWLCRKVDPSKAARVKNLDFDEIRLRSEMRRFYPNKNLAGPVIGFTDVDNRGLEGIERIYDKALRGASGWVLAEKDAKGRMVFPGGPGLQFRMPKSGADVVLTLDEVIQHIAEQELDAAITRSRAKGGVCLVMRPQTGEVLALSVRSESIGQPVFNPNEPQRFRPGEWRNRAVTDCFEPGSVFKPVLAAAAIEEKVVNPYERIDCSAGSIQVADREIKDAHRNGVLSFADVIAESSNVGTIKVALRLGKERFAKYLDAFGFGKRTGIDLPGEVAGLLRDTRAWSGVSLAEIAIGQGIGVTPIQMAAAYCALANGGVLMKPYVVSEIVDRSNSGAGKAFAPQIVSRVVSTETTAKVTSMMKKVVEYGTGTLAKPEGYTAAGKTGTAQKIDQRTGRYSKKEYVSSFAGFVPFRDPKLVILVMIDTPENDIYGGTVAAPVFKAVAEKSLTYLHVPPDDVGGRMLLVTR